MVILGIHGWFFGYIIWWATPTTSSSPLESFVQLLPALRSAEKVGEAIDLISDPMEIISLQQNKRSGPNLLMSTISLTTVAILIVLLD